MLGLLTSLATFSLKNPKTIIVGAIGVGIFLFYIHYSLLVGERDKLRVAEAGYQTAVAAFVDREATLKDDIRLEREAARIATSERDAARQSIDLFRESRTDEGSIEWARSVIPLEEIVRLCAALPEMTGCQNIQLLN